MSTFQLESLPYQTDAVEAVVRVFEGTPSARASGLPGNRCPLSWDELCTNLQRVAQSHQVSDQRLALTAPVQGEPLDLCIEMETGTGKTLVYLRTLYRLHTVYGWNKFIIVVPSKPDRLVGLLHWSFAGKAMAGPRFMWWQLPPPAFCSLSVDEPGAK